MFNIVCNVARWLKLGGWGNELLNGFEWDGILHQLHLYSRPLYQHCHLASIQAWIISRHICLVRKFMKVTTIVKKNKTFFHNWWTFFYLNNYSDYALSIFSQVKKSTHCVRSGFSCTILIISSSRIIRVRNLNYLNQLK